MAKSQKKEKDRNGVSDRSVAEATHAAIGGGRCARPSPSLAPVALHQHLYITLSCTKHEAMIASTPSTAVSHCGFLAVFW